MSHRLSRGKRRYIARLVFLGWSRVALAVADMSPPGRGKTARREGRHYDGKKMSPPCMDCGRRMPGHFAGRCPRCLRRCVASHYGQIDQRAGEVFWEGRT